MLVRMLDRETRIPEEVMDTSLHLLNLPEERALQLVAEGLCVVVSPGGDSPRQAVAAAGPGVRHPR